MFMQADLEQVEVETPFNHWCASGHEAPEQFRRSGPDSPLENTRFFLVSGKNLSGIYCEPCLILAHWLAKQKK